MRDTAHVQRPNGYLWTIDFSSCYVLLYEPMPLPPEGLLFSVQMALTKRSIWSPMVPGLRKQIGERDERVIAIKFVSEMSIAYDIGPMPCLRSDPPGLLAHQRAIEGQPTDRRDRRAFRQKVRA